jgi:hypothetical protein
MGATATVVVTGGIGTMVVEAGGVVTVVSGGSAQAPAALVTAEFVVIRSILLEQPQTDNTMTKARATMINLEYICNLLK